MGMIFVSGRDIGAAPQRLDATLRKLWDVRGFVRPYRALLAGAVALVLVSALLSLASPQIMRLLLDVALPRRDAALLALVAAGLFLAPLVRHLADLGTAACSALVAERVGRDLRCRLYEHVLTLSPRFFAGQRLGDLVSRVGGDAGAIYPAVNTLVLQLGGQVATLLATAGALLLLDWRYALLGLAGFPPYFWVAQRFQGAFRTAFRRQFEAMGEVSAVAQEGLAGVRVVQALGREADELARLRAAAEAGIGPAVRLRVLMYLQMLALGAVSGVAPALVVFLAGLAIFGGQTTVGTLWALWSYLFALYGPAREFAQGHTNLQQSAAALDRVRALLDERPEVRDAPGALRLGPVRGHVALEAVHFAYTPERAVLRGLDLVAEPGQLVALVGPTGAGKSTVVHLLLRYFDPDAGVVRVDGHDLRTIALASWRAQVAVVDQEPFLFNASLAENVRYARPGAADGEVERAVRAAQLHEFAVSLPQGYETRVGERGVKLSGGEKQRLAIARALLRDPRVLVLDEATSSLDSLTERALQDALFPLMRGRTTIAIAHRLATVLAADCLHVLDGGRVVERGAHEQLVALGGLYASLYRTQLLTREAPAGKVVADEAVEPAPEEGYASARGTMARVYGPQAAGTDTAPRRVVLDQRRMRGPERRAGD